MGGVTIEKIENTPGAGTVRKPPLLRFLWVQIGMHILAWVPLAQLAVGYFTGRLTINPIQYTTQQLGLIAMLMFAAALAVTPLITLTGISSFQKLSRPLGLYAFMYTALHVLMYVGVDYGFAFDLLWLDAQGKSYMLSGVIAFVILLVLAITSFRWWMKHLKKSWKRLHRLVYAAGALAVLHYALAVKGDLFRLQGDIVKPALYTLLLIFLFGLRIPPVRRAVIHARQRLFGIKT
jgi:methionine sulfoxide reductase heme-binding subunit